MNLGKFFFSLLFLAVLGGCLSEEHKIRVAISPWIGYEPIYQAEEFGWLDKNVELVKGDSLSASFQKIISGEVDAAAMTMEDVIIARTKGVELTIVAVLDISAGADVVLSKDPQEDLQQLKGKRIGCENSALASLILSKMLDKAGLHHDDVTVLDLSPSQQLDAWEKDEVDVVITYEPFASKLIQKDAHYLISSREFPEMIFDVLAVRTDRLLQEHEAGVKKLLQAHFKALDYFHSNYKDVLYRIAAREGISPDDVKRALGGIVFPSKSANKAFFLKDSSLFRSAYELNTLMFERGFSAQKASLNNFADPLFLKD